MPLQEKHLTPGRRQFVGLAITAAALSTTRVAVAQVYPSRPVRLLVGFTAGGIADVIARIVAQHLTKRLGQPVIVENHPGAGGNLAMEIAANAVPDGHTILLISSTNAINENLRKTRKASLITDIIPVACIYRDGPGVMVVRQLSPLQSLPELIAYAKAHRGEVSFASAGVGTTQHLYGEMFKMLTGITMIHIPYRGAPLAVNDIIAGHVHVMFDTLGNCLPHIRINQLRPLGITTQSRISTLPDVPTIAEFVPGYEGSGWQGIGAPRDTPSNVITKLDQAINAVLHEPEVTDRFRELGYAPFHSEPQEFGRFIASDVVRWQKVMTFSGTRLD
jgi:tripartite-type tricarboxylate transporter receptor subunit TctC